MCELIPDATLNEAHLPPLLEALVTGLQAEPRVATNVCWAISALSERAYESAQSQGDDESTDPETYLLSKYFEALVERLLETTGRADGNQVRPEAGRAGRGGRLCAVCVWEEVSGPCEPC